MSPSRLALLCFLGLTLPAAAAEGGEDGGEAGDDSGGSDDAEGQGSGDVEHLPPSHPPTPPGVQSHAPVPKLEPQFKPVADLFFHLETGLDGELPKFELDRAWFGGQIRFADVLMLDVVMDGARFQDLANQNQPTPLMGFIARAFAEVHPIPHQPKLLWIRGGQTWTFLVPLENRTGGHRQVAKGWADRHGFQKSRDLGMSVGFAPWDGHVEFDLGVFNGGGFKLPELDAQKQVNAMVVVRPLKHLKSEVGSLFVALHGTWEPWHVAEGQKLHHRVAVSGLVGMASEHVHAGFEVHRIERDVTEREGFGGFAAYVHPTVPFPGAFVGPLPLEFEGLARVDVVDRPHDEPTEVLFDAGVGLALGHHLAVSVDYGFTAEVFEDEGELAEHRMLVTFRARY